MSHHRQLPQNATSGSQTESSHSHDRNGSSTPSNSGMLRLRAENASNAVDAESESSARHIRWSEDVIDNEGMGKKSSKVCCIYHKSRPVGESSSESESDSSDSSSSESDSDSEVDSARRSSNRQRGTNPQDGPSNQVRREHACSANHRHKRPNKRRKPSPNAYEKMPRTSKER